MRMTLPIALLFHINAAIASGGSGQISVEFVKEMIRQRSIFAFLRAGIGGGLQPRLDYIDRQWERALNDEWLMMIERYDERAAFGVEKNGMCLLMAYLLEGIRRSTRATIPPGGW